MSGRVKHKSRSTECSSVRHGRKKKSKKRSCSSSDDCVVMTGQRNSCSKEKRRKSRRKRRRRSSSSDSNSSDSSVVRIKLEAKPKQLLGKRPEFCKNARSSLDSRNSRAMQNARLLGLQNEDRRDKPLSRIHLTKVERRVLDSLTETRADKKEARERSIVSSSTEKLKKSRRRKRSSSSSSSTSDSGSSRSSSIGEISSGSSTSSNDSSERRRRQRRKKKKKLAKKLLKREEKKRKEEKRKLKRLLKEKIKVATAEVKHGVVKAPQDRLLKDINIELADRARAMAPMTREQWEKKQSVVRRVFDEETGRQRLIKGDGEILEEIVSRDRHMAINKKATKGDGEFFQSRLRRNK